MSKRLGMYLVAVVVLVLGIKHLMSTGTIPRPSILKSVVPVKGDDIQAQVLTRSGENVKITMASDSGTKPCVDGNTHNCIQGDPQEAEIWAWNGNLGWIYAVGGSVVKDSGGRWIQTSKGSVMDAHHVYVKVKRQDDNHQMEVDLADTANRLNSDPHASGVKFVTIMGNGAAQFLQDLKKACPTCEFEAVAVIGYSRGEDGFWGPKEAKENCEALRGQIGIAVEGDGDWEIGTRKLRQCGIPNNPDDTVYDPNAFNWENAPDYLKAVEMLAGHPVYTRPIKGNLLGKKASIPAKFVATWTPGDVNIAHKIGGLVPIMTTKTSLFEMPCVLIGIKSWDDAHHDQVKEMIAAILEGGKQVNASDAALRKGAELSQVLYQEPGADANYWYRYFKGVTERDTTGVMVPLGGSAVADLADNVQAFGLGGKRNLFATTYELSGRLIVQQYPNRYQTYPPAASITNTKYIEELVDVVGDVGPVSATVDSNITTPMKSIEGKRNYTVNFATGSDQILPSSVPTLNQLADEISTTNYIVAVHGHTDNTGTQGSNQALSERRALSVVLYLKGKGCPNTMRSDGSGQDEPIADNSTEAGRAKNRRVQIVLGTAN